MKFHSDSFMNPPALSRASLPPGATSPTSGAGGPGFFNEPFDLPYIATTLLDDRFFLAAYVLCGKRKRWEDCAAQLPGLFIEFMNEEISDHRLYKLTALMFQWSFRFFNAGYDCRNRLLESLDFIDQQKISDLIVAAQVETHDQGWGWRHPWMPWS